MSMVKRNYGWMLVTVLAFLPMLIIFNMLEQATSMNDQAVEGRSVIDMFYHISGEFAIRWMTAVLTLTPFFIVFGITNLFVRQAMGIATAVWSILHFVLFIWADGFLETFTQVNYIAGFIAVLILIPLLITSNRKSMQLLKSNWKKLQSLAYVAIILSFIHIILLEKGWLVYGIIVGLGFIIRIPAVKEKIIHLRTKKNKSNSQ